MLSARFGDIFRGNSLKAGLLTILLPEDVVEQLWEYVENDPAAELTVDLESREIRYGGTTIGFELDDFTRWRLLERARRRRADAHTHRRGRRVRGAPAGLPADHPAGPLSS